MKAIISNDKCTIKLPVPIGTAVFIHEEAQRDGSYAVLRKYDYSIICRNVYTNEDEAKDGEF